MARQQHNHPTPHIVALSYTRWWPTICIESAVRQFSSILYLYERGCRNAWTVLWCVIILCHHHLLSKGWVQEQSWSKPKPLTDMTWQFGEIFYKHSLHVRNVFKYWMIFIWNILSLIFCSNHGQSHKVHSLMKAKCLISEILFFHRIQDQRYNSLNVIWLLI